MKEDSQALSTPALPVPVVEGPTNSLLRFGGGKDVPLPLSPAMNWFGEVVGTFARGGCYLLAGAPGSRKSGLAMQLALDLARWGSRVLTAVSRTYLGTGTGGVIELQCSVGLASFGSRGKVLAPGLPRKEIEQLLACVAQMPGVEIGDLDFAIHARLPGGQPYRQSAGLALAMSLLASYLQKPIPKEILYLGEIDLCLAVRDVPVELLIDLNPALSTGEIDLPVKLIVPPSAVCMLTSSAQIDLLVCRRLEDAMHLTWPELR